MKGADLRRCSLSLDARPLPLSISLMAQGKSVKKSRAKKSKKSSIRLKETQDETDRVFAFTHRPSELRQEMDFAGFRESEKMTSS
jgi:hypothetical protein